MRKANRRRQRLASRFSPVLHFKCASHTAESALSLSITRPKRNLVINRPLDLTGFIYYWFKTEKLFPIVLISKQIKIRYPSFPSSMTLGKLSYISNLWSPHLNKCIRNLNCCGTELNNILHRKCLF